MIKHNEILDFWFSELSPKDWWSKNDLMDKKIKTRFGKIHFQATRGELYPWRESVQGRLAEIIILDQFSRNIYRGNRLSFAYDHMSLALAQELVRLNLDQELSDFEVPFAYMPFMHSESKIIHEFAVKLFKTRPVLKQSLDFELKHKEIIDRFDRYPHRNEILGRESTSEEINFLKQPGSSF